MWDERYQTDEYAYGKEPNAFLKDNFKQLPKGKILSLAEGEGRNAVFLAQMGYDVTAIDSSIVGLKKAEQLAQEHGVTINTIHADLTNYIIDEAAWDGIISIFCPMPSVARKTMHQKIMVGLKPNGVFLLEAYHPNQLQHNTGGGKSEDTMVTKQSLIDDFKGLEWLQLNELERDVVEGMYHTGLGAVTQAIGRKSSY